MPSCLAPLTLTRPYHWLKTEYLDRVHELNLKTWHFVLEDNPNLPFSISVI